MRLWRIAASTRLYRADDISGTGAAVSPGRWSRDGFKVVYCAAAASMAVLETAAHVDDGGFPLNRFLVAIEVPGDLWGRRRTVDVDALPPEWSAIPAGHAGADLGTDWLRGGASALLELPSVIVHEESIVLINPAHPDAPRISAQAVRKFEYDALFRR